MATTMTKIVAKKENDIGLWLDYYFSFRLLCFVCLDGHWFLQSIQLIEAEGYTGFIGAHFCWLYCISYGMYISLSIGQQAGKSGKAVALMTKHDEFVSETNVNFGVLNDRQDSKIVSHFMIKVIKRKIFFKTRESQTFIKLWCVIFLIFETLSLRSLIATFNIIMTHLFGLISARIQPNDIQFNARRQRLNESPYYYYC